MVFRGKPFFGQDRLDVLLRRVKQQGWPCAQSSDQRTSRATGLSHHGSAVCAAPIEGTHNVYYVILKPISRFRCIATISEYALQLGQTFPADDPGAIGPSTGEHPIRSNYTFVLAIAISLLIGAALMFASLHAAASHMQVTM